MIRVGTHHAQRQWLNRAVWAALALFLLAAGYSACRGGLAFPFFDGSRSDASGEVRIARLQDTVDAQSREIAAFEVGRRVDQQSLTESQRMIGDLQSQVARLNQDVEFYRGVLAKEFGAGLVRLQSVVIRPAARGGFLVEITIVRAGERDAPRRGAVRVALSGIKRGALLEIPFRELSSAGQREVPFELRYLETLRIPISVPTEFRPDVLTVELLLNPGPRIVDRRTVHWTVTH